MNMLGICLWRASVIFSSAGVSASLQASTLVEKDRVRGRMLCLSERRLKARAHASCKLLRYARLRQRIEISDVGSEFDSEPLIDLTSILQLLH